LSSSCSCCAISTTFMKMLSSVSSSASQESTHWRGGQQWVTAVFQFPGEPGLCTTEGLKLYCLTLLKEDVEAVPSRN
jgi:hypothetical protein